MGRLKWGSYCLQVLHFLLVVVSPLRGVGLPNALPTAIGTAVKSEGKVTPRTAQSSTLGSSVLHKPFSKLLDCSLEGFASHICQTAAISLRRLGKRLFFMRQNWVFLQKSYILADFWTNSPPTSQLQRCNIQSPSKCSDRKGIFLLLTVFLNLENRPRRTHCYRHGGHRVFYYRKTILPAFNTTLVCGCSLDILATSTLRYQPGRGIVSVYCDTHAGWLRVLERAS